MAKKVIGVYDTEAEVIREVNNLKAAGYTPDDIVIVASNRDEADWIRSATNFENTHSDDWKARMDEHEDESLWEKVKNFFSGWDDDSFMDGYKSHFNHYGLTDTDALHYQNEVERGKIVVLGPESYTGMMMDSERNPEHKIKLQEEELDINRHETSAGEVEIRKEVHEETKQVDIPVSREEVYVERKPVHDKDRTGTGMLEDETIRIPLKEEKVEVRKRPVVREEVEIGKKKVIETEHVEDTVKKEKLDMEMENKQRKKEREYDTVFLDDEEDLSRRNP